MKVGVLGTGEVGRTLASGFAGEGHQVMLGSRDARQEKVQAWVKAAGPTACAGTYAEAAAFGDIVVLAVPGKVVEEVIGLAAAANIGGKVLVDVTNPLDMSHGMPPTLFVGHSDSLGERIQRSLPAARVVKAFNSVGYTLMIHPELPCGPPDMFICGNDEGAKQTVTEILKGFGWPTIDIGGIEGARYLEPLCMIWVLTAVKAGSYRQAFKLLKG